MTLTLYSSSDNYSKYLGTCTCNWLDTNKATQYICIFFLKLKNCIKMTMLKLQFLKTIINYKYEIENRFECICKK